MPLLLGLDERPEEPLLHIHRAAVVPVAIEETFALLDYRQHSLQRIFAERLA